MDKIGKDDRKMIETYLDVKDADNKRLVHSLIALALSSVADRCVIPMQDYLGLGSEARINTPSTLGGNWEWRMDRDACTEELSKHMLELAQIYGRTPRSKKKK